MAIDTTSPSTTAAATGRAHAGTARDRHGRLRVHGRGPLAGLAQRPQLLRPRAHARPRRDRRPERGRRRGRGAPLRLAARRDRLAGASSPATTSTSSTSAPRVTPTPRSPSPRSRPASTCSARSRWPTPSPRPEPWSLPPPRRAAHGIRSMVGFTYRRVPAIALARQLVQEGRVGEIRHVRGAVPAGLAGRPRDAAHLADAEGPGRLGRPRRHRGPHHRPRPLRHRRADHRASARRPRPSSQRAAAARRRAGPVGRGGRPGAGPVTVDDAAVFIARLSGGALATFEATRFATGRKNSIRLEINGSRGSIAFDFEDMNVLQVYDADGAGRRVRVHPGASSPSRPTPTSSTGGRPATGSATSTASPTRRPTCIDAIAEGTDPAPSFADGLAVQEVLAAVELSAADRSCWTPIDAVPTDVADRRPERRRPHHRHSRHVADHHGRGRRYGLARSPVIAVTKEQHEHRQRRQPVSRLVSKLGLNRRQFLAATTGHGGRRRGHRPGRARRGRPGQRQRRPHPRPAARDHPLHRPRRHLARPADLDRTPPASRRCSPSCPPSATARSSSPGSPSTPTPRAGANLNTVDGATLLRSWLDAIGLEAEGNHGSVPSTVTDADDRRSSTPPARSPTSSAWATSARATTRPAVPTSPTGRPPLRGGTSSASGRPATG